jgi:hypothetical protein
MQANRRQFVKTCALSAAGFLLPKRAVAVGAASQVKILQLVYSGGNWHPRPTALRRLAWEVHKRTAVNAALEPEEVKATSKALSASALAYLSGDRPFQPLQPAATSALLRFINLGGTLIVDPAGGPGTDMAGFERSAGKLVRDIMPGVEAKKIPSEHVLYRAFYQIDRPVGRIEGPSYLTGYSRDERMAVIIAHHDLGGAWARDNLGNWAHTVEPGGERQREKAFRLGINMVLYALCVDYKNEEPHRRFSREITE